MYEIIDEKWYQEAYTLWTPWTEIYEILDGRSCILFPIPFPDAFCSTVSWRSISLHKKWENTEANCLGVMTGLPLQPENKCTMSGQISCSWSRKKTSMFDQSNEPIKTLLLYFISQTIQWRSLKPMENIQTVRVYGRRWGPAQIGIVKVEHQPRLIWPTLGISWAFQWRLVSISSHIIDENFVLHEKFGT